MCRDGPAHVPGDLLGLLEHRPVADRGVTKLAGTAQRLTAHGFLFSAVVLVTDAEPVRAALARTYPLLGLHCRPETAGCVAEHAPGVTVDDVIGALLPALSVLPDHR